MSRAAWVLAWGLIGCGPAAVESGGEASEDGASDDSTSMDTGESSALTTSGSSGVGDDTGAGTTTEAEPSDGSTSLGGTGTSTGEAAQGCRPVDLLFVVDNSGSMQDEQGRLTEAFPGFMSELETALGEAPDVHAMVVDVDAWQFETCGLACEPPPECLNPDGTCNLFGGPDCAPCIVAMACELEPGFSCDLEPEQCQDVLGAGVDNPLGTGASNMACDFATGARYMDSMIEPDFEAAFACAASVGTASYAETEKTMEAMVEALGGEGEAAECNAGFLRDDAVLGIVFVTDESDDPGDSEGNVVDWVSDVVTAKGDDAESVVVLGLFGDNDMANAICPPFVEDGQEGAEPAPRLRQFVQAWDDRGLAGSVCAEDYEPYFAELADVLAGAGC